MPPTTVPRFGIHEVSLRNGRAHGNPFLVSVVADWRHESGAELRGLPGFFDGDGTWKIRFAPTLLGRWAGITRSADSALDGIELPPVECVPNPNPAIRGRLRIDPEHPHRFCWEDGTPCVPLGFECDWLFALHQAQPTGFTALLDRIAERGFNYVVTNVYAHTGFSDPSHPSVFGPPKLYPWHGTNDAPDHAHLNLAFFRDFDQTVQALYERGIVMHLMVHVLNKRVRWPEFDSPEDDLYWRYVLARYQAYCNLVWDVGKECYKYSDSGYPARRLRFLRQWDAYQHLCTAHDPYAGSAGRFGPTDWITDFASDQVHLGETDALVREAVRRWRLRSAPYFNIEYGYEEGVEPIPTYRGGTTASWDAVLRWTCAVYFGGGYPCYYYSNTAWDLIRWEPEPPGWKRYRYLRDFVDQIDWNPLVPDEAFVDRGYCLAEIGRQYVIYLPKGGDVRLDLTAVPRDVPLIAEWMAIETGVRATRSPSERRFRTQLENPLPDRSAPCVTYVHRKG